MRLLIPLVAIDEFAVRILAIWISFVVQKRCIAQSEWTRGNVK